MSSLTDIEESVAQGKKAVEFANEGITGSMVILKRTSNSPYTVSIEHYDISKIANGAKEVPLDFINASENGVTEKMYEYLEPLVIGEPTLTYKNGLPVYVCR